MKSEHLRAVNEKMSHIPWGRMICHRPSLDRAQATEGGAQAPKLVLGYAPDGVPGEGGPPDMFWFYFSCRSGTFVKPDTVFITLRICRRRWGGNPKKPPPPAFSPAGPRMCPARRSRARQTRAALPRVTCIRTRRRSSPLFPSRWGAPCVLHLRASRIVWRYREDLGETCQSVEPTTLDTDGSAKHFESSQVIVAELSS